MFITLVTHVLTPLSSFLDLFTSQRLVSGREQVLSIRQGHSRHTLRICRGSPTPLPLHRLE